MIHWTEPPRPISTRAITPTGITERYFTDPLFAQRFYGAHWSDPPAIHDVAERIRTREYPRRELGALLKRQNTRWEMHPQTAKAIEHLESGALCVITGQQVGLFGGPLYTVYKALATVSWSRALADDLGHDVVPIFWLAGDDHDFAEINHVVLPDANGRPVTWTYDQIANPGARVSRVRLGDDFAAWLRPFLESLPSGPYRESVSQALCNAYRPGETWVNAFARFMTRWLGRFGIIFVNPDDDELKQLMTPIFEAEVRNPLSSRHAIAKRDTEIEEAGYSPQVAHVENGTPLFIDDENTTRRRVDYLDTNSARTPSGFRWSGRAEALSTDEFASMFSESPNRFSANALLRPVTGDAAFPTVLHVMGPGEIAYMAQSRVLYERHAIPMPIVAPRAGFTIVDAHIGELLERENLSVEEGLCSPDCLMGERARTAYEQRHAQTIDKLRQRIDGVYGDTSEELSEALLGLQTAVSSTRIKTHSLISKLERTVLKALRRDERSNDEVLQTITDALYPKSAPQERVFPVLPWLIHYGDDWLDALLDVMQEDRTSHRALFPNRSQNT